MAKLRSFCPYCGRIVPAGQSCPCRPRPKRKPTQGDKTRDQREPWRARYGRAEYQRNRQEAISRSHGLCVDCSTVCAVYRNGRWYTSGLGGEVDHLVALEDGGSDEVKNLALRCKSCHGLRDAKRRRSKKSK